MDANLLHAELATYNANREQLTCTAEGKYAVVSGNTVLGAWDTYEDALQAGYAAVGLRPFLVKQIRLVDEVEFIYRAATPCLS